MPATIPGSRATVALAIVASLAVGCTTTPRPILFKYREPGAPAEAVRGGLGLVGIGAGPLNPHVAMTGTPAKGAGEGARRGAGVGSLGSMAVGAASGDPRIALVGVAVAPLAAAIGAITGAIRARPAELVAEQEVIIQRALLRGDFPERLREKVLAQARRRTPYPVFATADVVEPKADEAFSTLGVDVVSVVLEGEPDSIRSRATLVITARVGLRSPGQVDECYSSLVAYRSRRQSWDDWAATDAARVVAVLDEGLATLAETIVDQVFLLYVVGD